ncbi:MAG: 4Fe-4S dicluster domain-containing protein [Gemmatimonadaceae bacterium]|nr:4Fe-4S dicluster domain-containing protein [Gemmatimonadaceae bacterium]
MSQPMGPDGTTGGVKRRTFLKVLGAAGAATTAVGCTNEQVEKLIPYLESPDQTVPGVSTYYSTTCRECATSCGVIAEVRDGRAIKLEGNPDHPVNQGALCARGQASLQGLYNPDRYRTPMVREGNRLVPTTWDTAITTLRQKLGEARGGAGNAVFINRPDSGSFAGFLDGWLAAYGFQSHIQYDPTADLAYESANQAAYGVAMPRLDFAAARLVISIGADFLDGWGASVPQQLSFGEARGKLQDGPRVVYIGARRSLTGLNADTWISCAPGSEGAIASALLSAVGGSGGTVAAAAQASGVSEATLQALADELRAARPSLVVSGVSTPDAAAVATTVAAINKATGAVGVTIKPADAHSGFGGAVGLAAMQTVANNANAGTVRLLFVRGANPAYDTPKAMQFAAAMAKVPYKVSFSSYPDETSELCDLVLPDDHFLESWGDAQAAPGVIGLQQPVMDRIFTTRATADVLLDVARGDAAIAGRYTQRNYREVILARYGAANVTSALPKALTTGTIGARSVAASPSSAGTLAGDGEFFLVTYPHSVLGAGEGANKPWLQELPDPVAKIVWQSWVEIHPSTAQRLGIAAGDHVTVTTAAGTITAPAWPYLGIRTDTVAIALGQGHTKYGRYAEGIGVNALDALGATLNAGGGLALTQAKARVAKAADHSPLVTLEGSARQHGRGIAQAITVADFVAGVEAEHHALPGDASHEFLPGLRSPVANDAQGDLGDPTSKDKGMYDPEHWSGMAKRRWAMTIDLAKCTGCSACVTACYAENNIPTVGARWQGRSLRPFHTADGAGWDTRPGANILKGREMAWIRIERYFEGGEDGTGEFEARFVPMMCQHCGNAPCEPVCPVYATYHAPDGLNVQVYNRCVGTRYCSNGCPYKVRYYNWHGYGEKERRQYAFPEPLHLQLNPDVTVRGKGVMEKCSFCVQRIREAETRAKVENRELVPDEFTTACAQACPSRAIVFGDAADDRWSVARPAASDARRYHVFEELNTYTAVVYLKKVNHTGAAGATAAPAAAAVQPQEAR